MQQNPNDQMQNSDHNQSPSGDDERKCFDCGECQLECRCKPGEG